MGVGRQRVIERVVAVDRLDLLEFRMLALRVLGEPSHLPGVRPVRGLASRRDQLRSPYVTLAAWTVGTGNVPGALAVGGRGERGCRCVVASCPA